MKHRHVSIFSFFGILFLMGSLVQAGVPSVMTYKGQLLDTSSQPVSGTNTIGFKLYNVESGGSAFWSETQTVTVINGSFTIQLGENAANEIDGNLFDGNTWLGITMAGGTEMTPRQKMTSVAYSLRAKVAESVLNTDSLIPAGSVMAYAGAVAPPGWMFCDGASLDRVTYSRLFAAIGTAHGASNGTSFNLPDFRGRFLRGVDHGIGRDPDRNSRTAGAIGGNVGDNVGSVQGNATKLPNVSMTSTGTGSGATADGGNHQHAIGGQYAGTGYSVPSNVISAYQCGGGSQPQQPSTSAGGSHSHSVSVTSITTTLNGGGDNETRSVNGNVEYIIKY